MAPTRRQSSRIANSVPDSLAGQDAMPSTPQAKQNQTSSSTLQDRDAAAIEQSGWNAMTSGQPHRVCDVECVTNFDGEVIDRWNFYESSLERSFFEIMIRGDQAAVEHMINDSHISAFQGEGFLRLEMSSRGLEDKVCMMLSNDSHVNRIDEFVRPVLGDKAEDAVVQVVKMFKTAHLWQDVSGDVESMTYEELQPGTRKRARTEQEDESDLPDTGPIDFLRARRYLLWLGREGYIMENHRFAAIDGLEALGFGWEFLHKITADECEWMEVPRGAVIQIMDKREYWRGEFCPTKIPSTISMSAR